MRSRGDAINLESRFPGSNHADPRCRLRLLPSSAFRLHFGTDDGGLLLSMCPSPHSTSHLPPIRALMDDGSWTVDGMEGFESKNITRRRCSPSASMEGCRSRRCYMQRGRAGLTWLRQYCQLQAVSPSCLQIQDTETKKGNPKRDGGRDLAASCPSCTSCTSCSGGHSLVPLLLTIDRENTRSFPVPSTRRAHCGALGC